MTTNSEWLESLAKSDPKALQAWFDAERVEETNVIGGETNGTADEITLPDGDAMDMLHKWIAGHDPHLRGHGLSSLEAIADMVERDYVLRSIFDAVCADRDGWKAKAEHYGDHVDRLMEAIRDLARKQPWTFDPEAPYKNAELVGKYIDELKAKAEIAERAMNAAAGKWARANAELRRDGGAPTLGDLYGILGGEEPHEEPDSREKLEADVRFRFGAWGDSPLCDEVFGWLDRQAEITKREWAHVNDAYIADVRAERNAAESRAAELEAEISKRDKGIERLKRQRDEARADLEAFAGMPSALAPSEHERVVDRLQRENIGLARDLAECSREREAYRRACGQLLDLADQMRLVRLDGCGAALVDEQGEVVS